MTNSKGDVLLVCLYLDDMVTKGSIQLQTTEVRRTMLKNFEMVDVGFCITFFRVEM